jgi:hypothetical protein
VERYIFLLSTPTLIVGRICYINSIRNLRHGFADNRSKNNIYQNQASRGTNAGANFIQSRHFMCLCEEILSFWSNHCWFMIQGQSWSVPIAHLWLLFKKMRYQEENYNFWDFSVCRICSINSIRNLRHGFADNRSKNNIYQNQASRGTNAGANFIQSRHFMSKIVVEKSQKL